MKPKLSIKTSAEIELMAEGGQKLAAILNRLIKAVRDGMPTKQLEDLANSMIKSAGGESTFKGFHGYPAVSCISINEEVVHGIPGNRILKKGDLVGIDVGMRYKGFCTDTAATVAVLESSAEAQRLLDVTKQSLIFGLQAAKPGNRIGDISHAIQTYVEGHGFGVVRDLTGHGIGRSPHEQPSIPNFGKPSDGPIIEEGMTLAIEPMVTAGQPVVKQLADGWTIVTTDSSLAAHFEHTIAITKIGPRILT